MPTTSRFSYAIIWNIDSQQIYELVIWKEIVIKIVVQRIIISIELFWLDNVYGILDQYHLFLAAFKPLKEGTWRLCKGEIYKGNYSRMLLTGLCL